MAISTIGSAGINQAADTTLCTTSGNVGIGTSSPSYKLDVNGAANIQAGYNLNVYGSNSSGTLAGLSMRGTPRFATDTGTFENTHILCGATYGNIIFAQGNSYTTSSNTERMRIDSSGNLLVGRTDPNYLANQAGVVINYSGNGVCYFSSTGTTARNLLNFMNGVGGTVAQVGAIQTSGSTTAYVTSSDYRLKENIQPMQGALATVAQLNPVTYTWKADGSDGQGFIAHELQAVVPDCVTGEKDAVDEEGKPVYQGIDTSFLVATLTAAIQELNAKIEAQAVEIAALKGAA